MEPQQAERERFEELRFYQAAMSLPRAAYRLAEKLPHHERYNLASQLRGAALSTMLNIAEGYGRYRFPDRLRFFYTARGSLLETLSGFVAAHGAGYVDDEQSGWIRQTTGEAAASLKAYIGFIRKQKQGTGTFGAKYIREPEVAYEIPGGSLVSPAFNFPMPDSPIPDSQFPDSITGDEK